MKVLGWWCAPKTRHEKSKCDRAPCSGGGDRGTRRELGHSCVIEVDAPGGVKIAALGNRISRVAAYLHHESEVLVDLRQEQDAGEE